MFLYILEKLFFRKYQNPFINLYIDIKTENRGKHYVLKQLIQYYDTIYRKLFKNNENKILHF